MNQINMTSAPEIAEQTENRLNCNRPAILSINSNKEDRVYTYSEAINMTGNGYYTIGLLITLSISILSMGIDMFGFSVVVSGCTCDFDLDLRQTSILLSIPFIGPILMAYPWGYISDTRGRRQSHLIAMWVSFIVSTMSAFSPNWVVLAVLKFISTSFCVQSSSYTLIGESSTEKSRDSYMLIMTSALDFSLATYVLPAYFILNLDFSYDFGYMTFTPWRLLTLTLALPLGISAFGTHFFYESPKFLVNAGRHDEALDRLAKIWKRNGRPDKYPVRKIVLIEEGNEKNKDASLLQSLLDQIVPLFKPPLLYRSIQLYFIIMVIYSTNNSYFIWFPYLADKLTSGLNSIGNEDQAGLCGSIVGNITQTKGIECTSHTEINLVWFSIAQGLTFVILMMFVTKLARRKKLLLIAIMTVSGFSCFGVALVRNNLIGLIMFFGVLLNELGIGIVYTYFVDLYPTSFRGMAACICVMAARTSALAGVNVLGAFIMSHCTDMLYLCGGLMFLAAAMSFLLPPDKPNR